MNHTERDIVIIGCPRSGKTTLTNRIMQDNNIYNSISLDSLTIAIKRTMPEVGIDDKSNVIQISKKIVPFLAKYLQCYKRDFPEKRYIVEGIQINPEDLIVEKFFNNAQVICLGYVNTTIDDIYNKIRLEDSKLEVAYTKRMTEEELKKRIAFSLSYSKFLQDKCEKYGIPFYQTNENREETLEYILKTEIHWKNLCDNLQR